MHKAKSHDLMPSATDFTTMEGVTCALAMARASNAPDSENGDDSGLTTCHASTLSLSASGVLVNHGASGGAAGAGCHVIERSDPEYFVSVEGIDNHVMEKHPITTTGGVAKSNRGWLPWSCANALSPGRGTAPTHLRRWSGSRRASMISALRWVTNNVLPR